MVYATAMSIVKNPADAEEVAQEAVLKAFANLANFPCRIKVQHLDAANYLQRSKDEIEEGSFAPVRVP